MLAICVGVGGPDANTDTDVVNVGMQTGTYAFSTPAADDDAMEEA